LWPSVVKFRFFLGEIMGDYDNLVKGKMGSSFLLLTNVVLLEGKIEIKKPRG